MVGSLLKRSPAPGQCTLRDTGAASAIGGRPSQQDHYAVIPPEKFPAKTSEQQAIFAVYDGHGSDEVAKHAAENVHGLFISSAEFQEGRYEDAIKVAFTKEDDILLRQLERGSEEPSRAGTTAALCYLNLTKGILVIGNVGDSHIIMAEYSPGQSVPKKIQRLTKPHNPCIPSERDRIEAEGGMVNTITGTERIGTLNLSRTLGDLRYKSPVNRDDGDWPFNEKEVTTSVPPNERGDMVSNEPHLERVELKSGHHYILALLSDGVTNSAEDESIVGQMLEMVSRGIDATSISEKIVDDSTDRQNDNSTCITVLIDA